MANFVRYREGCKPNRILKIIHTEPVENYTVYVVEVTVGLCSWIVKHRYSEFRELHEKLVSQHQLDKQLLPPKKLFGNQSENFVRKRQVELQGYLQVLLQVFTELPHVLTTFLNFHKYEIHGITRTLAEELYENGDSILAADEAFVLTPLQLCAICERLQLAEPPCGTGNARQDLGHILDFITRLKHLKVRGSKDVVGTSNIRMHDLSYELTSFKALQSLDLDLCNLEKISGVDVLKKILKSLSVHHSIKALKEMLLLEVSVGQWLGSDNEAVLVHAWSSLTSADFSHNEVTTIDESVKLMPRLEKIDLSHNCLEDIQRLQHLSALTSVSLRSNHIKQLNSLHTKLGNIKSLDLSGNQLESLQGFSKLYSLASLNVSCNAISQLLEVRHISFLPCLEELTLSGNPITNILDYRTKLFELFGSRAQELTLDKRKASQKELDTVAVLLAIQKARETKEKIKRQPIRKQHTREAQIVESSSSLPSSSHSPPREEAPHTSTASALAGLRVQSLAATALRDESPQMLRMQVELIREQGGEAWLSLLNEIQQLEGQRHTRPTPQLPHRATRGRHSTSGRTSYRNAPSSSSSDSSSSGDGADFLVQRQPFVGKVSPSVYHERLRYPQSASSSFILPETLPSKNDATFVSHLSTLTPSPTRTKGRRSRRGSDDGRPPTEERPVHLMWCSTLCYTNPYQELPTCVYITTENLHIFYVLALRGADGQPSLQHMACISLAAIHQIVLGHRHMYIRVEEAFVGPMGTYTFLSASASKTELFLESLKLAYRRAAPDPAAPGREEPHVVVNGETDLKLKHVLNGMEGRANAADVRVVLYMLVHAADVANVTHSLVVTDRFLYLLQEDYVLWPQPTFAVGPSLRPQFVVVQAFPVSARIGGVHMYDSDTYCRDAHETSLSRTFCGATNAATVQLSHFIGYGVRLTMDLGAQGVSTFDIRVPTSGMRDQFLGALTEVRSGQSSADRAHGRAKPRKKRGVEARTRGRHHPALAVRLQLKPRVSDSNESTDNNSVDSARLAHHSDDSTVPSSGGGGLGGSDGTPMRDSPTGESRDLVDSSLEEFVEAPEPPATPVEKAASISACTYPTLDLLNRLDTCNENMFLLRPLSAPLQQLAAMTGEELLNHFHSRVAQIGVESDELRHVLWTPVTPYLAPGQEVTTCVMLSTRAVYFVSDDEPVGVTAPPGWRTHTRNKSDSFGRVGRRGRRWPDAHNATVGIIQRAQDAAHKLVRAYHILPLTDLSQVHVGLFDQRLRLAGNSAEAVFTCVTRDNRLTEQFVSELSSVLAAYDQLPPSAATPESPEPDFYAMYGRRERGGSDAVSVEATSQHAHVQFVYPREDSISDMSYLITESILGPRPAAINVSLYVMLFVVDASPSSHASDVTRMRARSLVVADGFVCLAVEDYVSYPLPRFARFPPNRPRYEIAELRRLEHLRRVALGDASSHHVTLVFADENEELQVDTSRRYYDSDGAGVDPQVAPVPDVTWTLLIQNTKDKERLVRLVSKQWAEVHEGDELPVDVSAS